MLRRVEIDGGGSEENTLLRSSCRVEIGLGANGRFREKPDMERLRVIRCARKRVLLADRSEGTRIEQHHPRPESCARLDFIGERNFGDISAKHRVAGLNVGLGVAAARCLDCRAQFGHGQLPASANIDSAEQKHS